MDWDTYLMGFAEHAAQKSKDSTQVGAALVGNDREVLLTGYNGPPIGVRDDDARFVRPTKYLYASHAEANLIAFAARHGISTNGLSIYVTHFPCSSCARSIIQAGVKRVVTGGGQTSMPHAEFEAAERMFREAGVEVVRTVEPKVAEPAEFETIKIPTRFCNPKEAYQASQALLGRANSIRSIAQGLYSDERERERKQKLAAEIKGDLDV